jgi:hypothetical protein
MTGDSRSDYLTAKRADINFENKKNIVFLSSKINL